MSRGTFLLLVWFLIQLFRSKEPRKEFLLLYVKKKKEEKNYWKKQKATVGSNQKHTRIHLEIATSQSGTGCFGLTEVPSLWSHLLIQMGYKKKRKEKRGLI